MRQDYDGHKDASLSRPTRTRRRQGGQYLPAGRRQAGSAKPARATPSASGLVGIVTTTWRGGVMRRS